MLNIDEINKAICELENTDTSYITCQKLANLYVVKDHYPSDIVEKEYNDILPSYQHYCDVKRQYQLGEIPEQLVIDTLLTVCKEICEFISILYNNTDSEAERRILAGMLDDMQTHIV